MDKEALFQARTNPDFLKYLEEARVNSMKAEDIGLMYETLDSMLVLDLDEENVNKFKKMTDAKRISHFLAFLSPLPTEFLHIPFRLFHPDLKAH